MTNDNQDPQAPIGWSSSEELDIVLMCLDNDIWLRQRTHQTGSPQYRYAVAMIEQFAPWYMEIASIFTNPWVCPKGCGGDPACFEQQCALDLP